MLGVGNYSFPSLLSTTKVLWCYKTFVVESRDGFELSDDNKLAETNGTHETNTKPSNKDGSLEVFVRWLRVRFIVEDGSLEDAEAVQAATDKRRD